MAKILKGTYLWNVDLSTPPFVAATWVFTNKAYTNYGMTTVSGINVEEQNHISYIALAGGHEITYIAKTNDWLYKGAFRMITFTCDEEIDDFWYNWFIENTISLGEAVELTGTWQWNDILYGCYADPNREWAEGDIVSHENVNAIITASGNSIQAIRMLTSNKVDSATNTQAFNLVYVGMDIGGTGVDLFQPYSFDDIQGEGVWYGKGCKTITFLPGTTVSGVFYSWLMLNAQSVELCELSGRWKWNNVPAYHTRDFEKVKLNFKSGNTDMKYMLVENDDDSSVADLTYVSSNLDHEVYGFSDQSVKNVYALSGIWCFNDVLLPPSQSMVVNLVNTITEGWSDEDNRVEKLKVDLYNSATGSMGVWYDSRSVYGDFDEDGTREWLDDYSPSEYTKGIKTLIFGSDDSVEIVSEEFYTWFTANARVIEGEVTKLEKDWTDISYKVIDFDTPQAVTKEFYDWFTANATEQALTEISGVWRFKSDISSQYEYPWWENSDVSYEPVSFTTVVNNKTYVGMRYGKGSDEKALLEYGSYIEPGEVIEYRAVYDHPDRDWIHELTDIIIDFGSNPQLISSGLYGWLKDRATRDIRRLSGTWVLKDKLSAYYGETIIIGPGDYSFTNQGKQYAKLSISGSLDDSGRPIIKYDDSVVYEYDKWHIDTYKIISIIDYLLLTENDYEWFMNNLADREHLLIEKTTLMEIADVIRAKTGKTDSILVSKLKGEIDRIQPILGDVVSVSIREIET